MPFVLLPTTEENRHGYAHNRGDNKFLLIVWRLFATASRREYHIGDKTDTAVYSLNKHLFLYVYVDTMKGPKYEI